MKDPLCPSDNDHRLNSTSSKKLKRSFVSIFERLLFLINAKCLTSEFSIKRGPRKGDPLFLSFSSWLWKDLHNAFRKQREMVLITGDIPSITFVSPLDPNICLLLAGRRLIDHLNIDVNEDTCNLSLGPNGYFYRKDARYRIDQNILPTLAHATTWDSDPRSPKGQLPSLVRSLQSNVESANPVVSSKCDIANQKICGKLRF
ncbi:hypothetical protein Tco_0761200 [Tanacetum coccineum]